MGERTGKTAPVHLDLMETITASNFDRLAKAMMQLHNVSYGRASEMLGELRLQVVCGEEIRESAALQAALLTAINTGKRAFRGGVSVHLPGNVDLRVPWPGAENLNAVARDLGAEASSQSNVAISSFLNLGGRQNSNDEIRVLCDGWRAVLVPSGCSEEMKGTRDFALGGVFAGALGVAYSFLNASGIIHRELDGPMGISLWRPDLCWREADAIGPALQQLPAKLWLLGLGHLGQAYAWTIGLLPFASPQLTSVYLQDFDVVEHGNWSAGLLSEQHHVDRLKTRVVAEWLEGRRFTTRLVERRFNEHMQRDIDEPRVALCGFDNAESRQMLEDIGWELIVDASLGATLDHFDRLVLRTFPESSQKARDIWSAPTPQPTAIDPALFEGEVNGEECGILFQEIAQKAISSSFTGACASALAIAEILRAIHGGRRCEFVALQLRDLERPEHPYRDENYQLRIARNGLVPIAN